MVDVLDWACLAPEYVAALLGYIHASQVSHSVREALSLGSAQSVRLD